MTVALDLSPHLRAARRALLYLIVGLGQGLTYLLVLGGGLVLGMVLAPLWIGLPLLTGTARLTWRLAEGERRQANRLLEAHLPADRPAAAGGGVRELLGNRSFWRVFAMLILKLPTVLVGLVLALRAGAARGRARRARGERAGGRRRAARRAVGARPGARAGAVRAGAAGHDRLDRRAGGRPGPRCASSPA